MLPGHFLIVEPGVAVGFGLGCRLLRAVPNLIVYKKGVNRTPYDFAADGCCERRRDMAKLYSDPLGGGPRGGRGARRRVFAVFGPNDLLRNRIQVKVWLFVLGVGLRSRGSSFHRRVRPIIYFSNCVA